MTESAEHPLRAELEHWNSVLALRYDQLLESITALDLVTSHRHIAFYRRLHGAGGGFYQQQLSPLLTAGDEMADQELVRLLLADRMILDRTLDQVGAAIARLDQVEKEEPSRLRAAMVEELEILVRFRNILVRHQQRQQEVLFPQIEQLVDDEESLDLVENLRQLMQPLKLSEG